MTIAIGMLVREGLVLASDTQDSAGWFKGNVHKTESLTIWGLQQWNRTYSLSGAGYGPFLDCLQPIIQGQLERDCESNDQLPTIVESCLNDFYAKHIDRPNVKEEEVGIALLIGSACKGKIGLFATDRTSVRRSTDYDAIGIGDTRAKELLETLHHPLMPLDAAVLMASYIVWKVKNSVDGCGHYTDIIVVLKNHVLEIGREFPQRWEIAFRNCDILSAALCRSVFDTREQMQAVDYLEAVKAMRSRFHSEIYKVSLKLAELGHLPWTVKAPEGRSL